MHQRLLCFKILLKGSMLAILAVLFYTSSFSQSARHISGHVSDQKGRALPGVTVTVIGDTKGVLTDEEGNYSIDVKSTDKLLFSYLGMEPQTITVGIRNKIDVVLEPKPDALQEVTVVAFGKQKKESVVGSITSIRPGELKTPSSNLTTALAGRIAGLIAFQRSGEPGADNADFFIRGVTSFGYSNRPLILVDGIEMPASELARLQVDDIASFSIMKDATATALYGARGANGVILITTKEGKEGKAKITFRVETSLSEPTRQIEFADPVTYMKLADEAYLTRGDMLVPYSQEKIDRTAAGEDPLLYPAVDWQSMLLRKTTINNRFNLSVRGGGKVARYYVSATFNKDNGMLKVDKRNNFNNNIDLRTYGLRSNININLTKSTEAVVRLNSTWTDYNGPLGDGASFYKQIVQTNPVLFPAYYEPDSTHKNVDHILFGNYDVGEYLNPYANLMKGYRDYTNSMVLAQFEIKQDLSFILKGLKLSAMYNTTRHNFYQVSRFYNPSYYTIGSYNKKTGVYSLENLNPTTGHEYLSYSEDSKQITSESYFQGILSYNKDFPGAHAVSGTLVYNMKNRIAANAGSLQNSLPQRNLGLAGRFTYAYQDRYFLELNFGYNGSERFSKAHRFGFFPSVGGAWYLSRESFWGDDLKRVISKVKLRATYGLVGNDAIGDIDDRFFYLSQVNPDAASRAYKFGIDFNNTINGVTVGRYANNNITWETSRKLNLAAEISLFNFIDVTAELYKEDRYNILMTRAFTPNTMGLLVLPRANVGEAKSHGIDLSVEFNRSLNNSWFISGRGNFTYAKGVYEKYEEPDYSAVPWRSRVGLPIGQQFGYVAERLFIDDEEVENSPAQFGDVSGGDIKFKDINKDGVISGLDQVPIGYPTTPEMTYGFGFSIGYKGFDLSSFFQGSAKSSFWIDASATAPFVGFATGQNNQLLKAYADNHWSEDNRNLKALWPALNNKISQNNTERSTWFMRNGSFLRIKQIEIGYSLNQKIINKIGLDELRIYINGTNLYNFSAFKLWDPEMGGNGLGYPLQRVFNLGIHCTL